jgi:hypothetical protein
VVAASSDEAIAGAARTRLRWMVATPTDQPRLVLSRNVVDGGGGVCWVFLVDYRITSAKTPRRTEANSITTVSIDGLSDARKDPGEVFFLNVSNHD